MAQIVIDTCVLADALFSNRPRHAEALRLFEKLRDTGTTVLVPAHAYFELASVAMSEKHRRGVPLALGTFGRDIPTELRVITIDLDFVNKYLIETLTLGTAIDLGGADSIFVALALRENLPLVSEDERMMKRAKSVGVQVFTPAEFLAL